MYFFNKIIKYIKKILKIEKKQELVQPIEKYDDLYNKIEVGTIIWAKRYKDEEEKQIIPDGHREGPYVVIKKENNKIYCLRGTSVIPYEKYCDMNFYLDNYDYKLSKPTYFRTNLLVDIDEYRFVNILDQLNEKDMYSLFRKIKVENKSCYDENHNYIILDLPILVGDIIKFNDQYLIVMDDNEDNIICVPLESGIKYENKSELNFNNFNNLNYSKTICLKKNNNIKYINAVNNQILKNVLNKWQEYINNRKNVEITQRGSIIFKDNKYYYVYGEEGDNWLVFEIIKEELQNFEQLEIGNTNYYTKFQESKINKKDLFTNIYLCLDEEKDKIKSIRKSYKESRKTIKKNETINYVCFDVGDIIQNVNYKNKRFIVIKVCKKTYECLCIDKTINGIYDPVLLRKADVKLAKNNNITGIKWLEEHPKFKLKHISDPGVIDEIFKTQKKYLNNTKNSVDVLNENHINNISKGTIVKKDENSDETFKVLQIMGEMIVCQSCNDLKLKHYFNKNSVIVVEGKQKRK